MAHVTSKDGTKVAYDRQGGGPAIILVGGGLDDGSENAPLAAELADHFTVYNYARRGRGDSGDTAPYAVEREIEDLRALIAEAGGSAHLYGVSSGGMFALETAAAGLAIGRLAVYEVPYDTSDDAPRRYREYRARLGAALDEGRRGEAVELFMRLAGSSEEDVRGARMSPYWSGLEALAHTLAYDAALYGRPPADRRPTASRRSRSRRWSPLAEGAATSSSRPPTRSPRASRGPNAGPSKAKGTWSTRRRSRPQRKQEA